MAVKRGVPGRASGAFRVLVPGLLAMASLAGLAAPTAASGPTAAAPARDATALQAGSAAAPEAAPATPAAKPNQDRSDTLERHPLELRALVEPEAVLAELKPALISAQLAGDSRQVALLYLAQANACRVVADWDCQREAGIQARLAAAEARAPQLAVRGLIAESRARMAMQDYTRGERLLGDAELLLRESPQAELTADVMLAYSSLSYTLGKHALAADYADRGLAVLGEDEGLGMRARLTRNRARAEAQMGKVAEANRSLQQATALSQRLNDPKLAAELYLEGARVARLVGDADTQRRNGERVLAMAERLKNSQLAGLGHEVLGLAAADAGDGSGARRELLAAQQSFRMLELQSDELRVLRELVAVLLRFSPSSPELAPLFERFLSLDNAIAQIERAQAADDFDARLKYAERENHILRLEGEKALARERELALARSNRLSRILMGVGILGLLALAGFFVLQRRSNHRLSAVLAKLGENERRYRTLAENSSDMVVRLGLDGTPRYVSPSVREILGIEPEALVRSHAELVHPDDRERVLRVLEGLGEQGGSATVRYRARHASGHYVWIESLARRVGSADGSQELVYAGRDISTRVRAEQALEAIQARLRSVTDNIPALIAHIDNQERYTFANSLGHQIFDTDEGSVIGRTVRDVRGEAIYSEIKDHIATALSGKPVTYDGQAEVKGQHYYYQSSYVPDIGPDGVQNGFFSFTYDITKIKQAEHELETLARKDGLTGLANRRYFDERLAAALARSRRQASPVALLYLDIDHFKGINDSLGHAAGDEVIREFSRRLSSCVRASDLVARIGGDEFAVLVEGAGPLENAQGFAEKLIERMAEPVRVAGSAPVVSTSIGIAYTRAGCAPERLLGSADQALYSAKSAGRRTWRLVEVE